MAVEVQLGALATFQFVCFVFVTGVVCGVLLASKMMTKERQRAVRIKAIEKLGDARPEDLKFLLSEVPGWVRSSDVEKANWLSNGVKTMWPFLDKAISHDVTGSVNPILADICKTTPILRKLALRNSFTLGHIAPTISGVKHVSSALDEVILDISLRWKGEPDVHLDVVTSVSPNLVVSVDDLVLDATVRVILRPLCSVWPTFSAITIAMMEKPVMNFSLRAIGGYDIMSFPGLGDTLNSVIKDLSFDFMTWPQRLVIPILDLSEEELLGLQNKPKAVLQVRVVSAKDLPNVDLLNKTDPFVETTVRGKRWHRSSTKDNDLNPVWNEEFVMLVEDETTQDLKIRVSDDGRVARVVGLASIPLSTVEKGDWQTFNVRLQKPEQSSSMFKSAAKGLKNMVIDKDEHTSVKANKKGSAGTLQLELQLRPIRQGNADSEDDFYGGMISVTLERASNLITTQSFGRKPSPMAIVFVNKPGESPIPRNVFKSEIKAKTFSPDFNWKVELIVYDKTEIVTVKIVDGAYRSKNPPLLGEYTIPVTDVIASANDEIHGVFRLNKVRKGDISLDLQYSALG